MELLTQEALRKARKTIADNFMMTDSLDGLGVLSFQLEKQLQAADSQLNSSVQGKLDSLKRAVDLMDESTAKLTKLSTNISRIDEKIALTNTCISNYDHLKRVHHARDNLSKVISQVEFFAKVPERVTHLTDLLNNSPSSLKEVFIEAIKLESLRAALMKEIQVNQNKRKSSVTTTTSNSNNAMKRNSNYTQRDFDEDENIRKIRDAVTNHLAIVPELVELVGQRTMGNIDRMFDLSVNSPADLVMSFEIIEMQTEYNMRRNNAILKTSGSDTPHTKLHDNLCESVHQKIKAILCNAMEGDFEMASSSMVSNDGKAIAASTVLIIAANQILQKLTVFKQDVVPCIPDHYQPLAQYLDAFDEFLLPRVTAICLHLADLKVFEILDFINWIEYYSDCISRLGFATRDSLSKLLLTKHELMLEYKDRIKSQVVEWFDNIKRQALEINVAHDGTLVTSNPEDMFNILHSQLEVAKEKLPLEYTKEVAVACLQVLQSVQRESYDNLANTDNEMEAEVMCTLINDNHRMKLKCDEFGEYLMKFVEEGNEREIIKAILTTVSQEYAAIASMAVKNLTKSILIELEQPIFMKLYTTEWEESDTISNTLIVTLADYFQDLSTWLTKLYFKKFIQVILFKTIERYTMYMRKVSKAGFIFVNELTIANRIIRDKTIWKDFFELHMNLIHTDNPSLFTEDPAKSALLDDKIIYDSDQIQIFTVKLDKSFELMDSLARIVTSKHPSSVDEDIRKMFDQWGIDGMRLVHAAVEANPSLSKHEKKANMEIVHKLFNEGNRFAKQYNKKILEEFKDFDEIVISKTGREKRVDNTKKESGFWGRRKP